MRKKRDKLVSLFVRTYVTAAVLCCCKHNILNLHIYGLCALAWQAVEKSYALYVSLHSAAVQCASYE